jgi:hypothetical protein
LRSTTRSRQLGTVEQLMILMWTTDLLGALFTTQCMHLRGFYNWHIEARRRIVGGGKGVY